MPDLPDSVDASDRLRHAALAYAQAHTAYRERRTHSTATKQSWAEQRLHEAAQAYVWARQQWEEIHARHSR